MVIEMNKIKWHVMLIVFLISLVFFFGGSFLFERFFRENPLEEELCKIEGVERVEINGERKNTLHVDIFTGYTGDLPEMVEGIDRVLSARVKKEYDFELHDRRNEKVEVFFREVKPAIYEGARVGNYRSIQETVDRAAAGHEVEDYFFSVDDKYVYLQARDGKDFLYVVVPHLGPMREDKLS